MLVLFIFRICPTPKISITGEGRVVLSFAEQHLDHCLPNGFERIGVDVFHCVVDGVPCRSEGTLWTRLEIWNDVDGWNVEFFVHGNMVVGHHTSLAVGKQ